jgi:hypothetical protein
MPLITSLLVIGVPDWTVIPGTAVNAFARLMLSDVLSWSLVITDMLPGIVINFPEIRYAETVTSLIKIAESGGGSTVAFFSCAVKMDCGEAKANNSRKAIIGSMLSNFIVVYLRLNGIQFSLFIVK